MIGGYNRIFLQPPRSALRGRSRSAGTTVLSAFSPYRKPGQRGPRRLCYEARRTPGGISAARTVGRFSAESRHRSRVPSLIKVPVSSPFRVGFLPENVPRRFESLVSLAPCRVSHTGREWRFTLSGFSFNPWFDFSFRRKGCLFRFRRKKTWQKMRSGSLAKPSRALPVCVLCRCCQAFPFHDRA